MAWDLARLHDESIQDAQRRLESLVNLYAEEVATSINSIDYLLIDFRDEWDGDREAFEALVQRRNAYVDPELGYSASIINQQGQLVATTVADAKLPLDMRDRESYQYHLHHPDDALYIGKPIPMRVKDEWRIPLSRPLFNPDGSFNGLVAVTVLPSYFSRFHHRVDLGKDSSVFLGRTEGYALARHPKPELALGGAIDDAPWVGAKPSQKGFFQKLSRVDQIERLYAWRTLEKGNLAVVMGMSTQTILAHYHHHYKIYTAGGAAATVLLLLAAYIWGRHQRQRTQADAELQKMEAALAHAQKLESLGKLTGGVTHDFNHILQIITNNLYLIERAGPGSPQIEPHVKGIAAATEQGRKLAAQLLMFARRQPLCPTSVDFKQLLQRMDCLIQQLIGPNIRLHVSIAENAWRTKADSSLLENVLLNLAANARDAMKGQGVLQIMVSNKLISPAQARYYSGIAPGEYVLLEMKDTGCGMPPEVIERAFEPFFTTKPEAQGTGLGLAMAYGFVKESNGHIQINTTVGQGTTIAIFLPRTLDAEIVTTAATPAAFPVRPQTLLFVEDSAQIRTLMGMMLEDLGYRVLPASNAQEALAILEKEDVVDVLFTDVRMPGLMSGVELASRVKALRPGVKILLTSGYDEWDDSIESRAAIHDLPLLNKPYTVQEADAMLQKLVSGVESDLLSA